MQSLHPRLDKRRELQGGFPQCDGLPLSKFWDFRLFSLNCWDHWIIDPFLLISELETNIKHAISQALNFTLKKKNQRPIEENIS